MCTDQQLFLGLWIQSGRGIRAIHSIVFLFLLLTDARATPIGDTASGPMASRRGHALSPAGAYLARPPSAPQHTTHTAGGGDNAGGQGQGTGTWVQGALAWTGVVGASPAKANKARQRKDSDDVSGTLPLHHGSAARNDRGIFAWRKRRGGASSRVRTILILGAFAAAALNVYLVLRGLGAIEPILRAVGWDKGARTGDADILGDDTPKQAERKAEDRLDKGEPSDAFCTGARLRGWGAPPAPLVCAHGTFDNVTLEERAQPNTLLAFQQALDAGVSCVEVDAARTIDGELLVLHRRELGRYLPADEMRRQVCEFTKREIMDLTRGGAHNLPPLNVATVYDALHLSLSHRLGGVSRAIVDLKVCEGDNGIELDARELVRDVVLTLRRVGCGSRCLVWAKSDEAVARTKSVDDLTQTGYVVMNHTASSLSTGHDVTIRGMAVPEGHTNQRGLDWTQLGRSEVVAMYYGTLDAARLAEVHRHGKELYAWVANDAPSMTHCLDHFVDGVVTNHPARLMAARDIRLAACRARYRANTPDDGG